MNHLVTLVSLIVIITFFSCSRSSYLNINNGYGSTIQNVTWGDISFGNIDASGQKKLDVEAGSNPLRFSKSDTLYETTDNIKVDARSGATFDLNLNTKIHSVIVSK
jgi:hypothetical protein